MSIEQKFRPVEKAAAVRDLIVAQAEAAGLEINALVVGSLKEALPEAGFFPLVVIELEGGDNQVRATQQYDQSWRFRVHYVAQRESGRNNAIFVWEGARKLADILASDTRLGGAAYAGWVMDLRCNEGNSYSAGEHGGELSGASVGYKCRCKVTC